MNWTTKVDISKSDFQIVPQSQILSIGSCFADNIGSRMKDAGFSIDVNPFGVLFNPFSILNSMISALNDSIDPQLYLERSGLTYHYNYHSELNGTTAEDLQIKVKQANEIVKSTLLTGDVLQLTFGTAWVYQLVNSEKIVANCHKIPQSEFKKVLLNIDILKTLYTTFLSDIFQRNPKMRVVLTVSPVRHVKDGLSNNSISKSILHLLCDDLNQKFKQVSYFPAYEIVIDELRDYRFYKEDMVHPSDQAVDYVFKAYQQAYFNDSAAKMVELAEKLKKAQEHRFMNASEEEKAKHAQHIEQLKSQLLALRTS